MRNNRHFVLSVLLVLLITAGCSRINTVPKNDIVAPAINETITPTVSDTVIVTPTPTINETITPTISENELYENKEIGFILEFPSKWKGNYIVHEYDDFIQVCFVGESETSKEMQEGSNQVQGLSMFYIGSESCVAESEFIDSVREVGMIDKIKYYHFTNTDFPLGALTSEYIEGAEEKKLAEADYAKAMEMQKDIDTILSTFREND